MQNLIVYFLNSVYKQDLVFIKQLSRMDEEMSTIFNIGSNPCLSCQHEEMVQTNSILSISEQTDRGNPLSGIT